ncbi:MAG TPA: hypothetical protein VMY39_10680 [Planctomycetota bacterium]|nr:hypothetical protein [Planctomycetota bacterium]
MRTFLSGVDDLLHGRGRFAASAPPAAGLTQLVVMVLVFGALTGAVMGSFSAFAPGRWVLMLYAAVKVPMLLMATFLVCLPSFFVVNALVGLREDWSRALAGIVSTQAALTVVLAALAPVVAFFYVSNVTYDAALVLNGLAFATAVGTAQVVTMRVYRPLIAANPRHRLMLWVWVTLYVFVGIQMAWTLRPFVGAPGAAPAFFREDAWGNAYVIVARLVGRTVWQLINL